jgi:hypothetical protein
MEFDMAKMTQHPILKMEISDSCVCAQHLVGGGKVWVYLIEFGPSKSLMDGRVWHSGECCDWQFVEAIDDVVGASYFIIEVNVELLQVCGPLLIAVILQFYLCLHELQWLMINVDESLLTKNVMSPMSVGLQNAVHFFVIIRVLTDNI